MDRKLQQRIVGIFVLASFVLLIAPVLLDAEGRIPEKITSIPPQPKRIDVSSIVVSDSKLGDLPALPDPSTVLSTVSPNSESTAMQDASTNKEDAGSIANEDATTQKVAIPNSGGLWSVQVASFLDPKKASAFRDALRAKNYEPYVREKLLSDGSLFTQVFVGPVAKKSAAKLLKEQIKTEIGEQGLIVTYRE